MNIRNGDCLHVVLFGTFGENRYFLGDYRDGYYDLIAVNANMIAHAPEGMAAFIAGLKNKSFFCDPQTHAFQHDPKTIMRKRDGEWKLKQSIRKLSTQYGSVIGEKAGKASISVGDVGEDELRVISGNVLRFQWSKLQEAIKHTDLSEFLEDSGQELRPEFLVAPYFYLDADNIQGGLECNLRFIDVSLEEMPGDPASGLWAEVVLSKELLFDKDSREKIARMYSKCDVSGYVLWIDDFSELDQSEKSLSNYVSLLSELSKGDKPIVALHGSFFSIALSSGSFGKLSGVGHGMEYGEARSVIPVGGGVPLAKFYFPAFHKRIDYYPHAAVILLEQGWEENANTYWSRVCKCKVCRNLIDDDVQKAFDQFAETKISSKNKKAYPTGLAMDKSRRHYLEAKRAEYEFCKSSSGEQIVARLRANKEVTDNVNSQTFPYLPRWIKVLS